MASMSLRPLVSSTASSSFTSVSSNNSCVKRPSSQGFKYPAISYFFTNSDYSSPSSSSLSSGTFDSVLPLSLISLFALAELSAALNPHSPVTPILFLSLLFPTPPPPYLTACISPSIPASRLSQRFTLLYDYLNCTTPYHRMILAMRRRHTYLIPAGLTPRHLSRAIICDDMMAR